jgi:hypothetical protein
MSIIIILTSSCIEVRRDFTGYYDDKMRRVQRKVDNLRKAALSSWIISLI